MKTRSSPLWLAAITGLGFFLLLFLGVPLWAYWLDKALGISSGMPDEHRILRLMPSILGLLLMTRSVWDLHAFGRGTPNPLRPPRELVKQGAYRHVRNPMMIGALLFQSGLGLLLGLVMLYVLLAVAWIIAHLYIVYVEEPELQLRFGQSYLQYKAEVGRWLPSLSRKARITSEEQKEVP